MRKNNSKWWKTIAVNTQGGVCLQGLVYRSPRAFCTKKALVLRGGTRFTKVACLLKKDVAWGKKEQGKKVWFG